jgi:hypothetical protein
MSGKTNHVDPKRPKKRHNFKLDALLVLLGLGMVAAVFSAGDRFALDPGSFLSGRKSNALVHFAGPLTPADLNLDKAELRPLYQFAAANAKRVRQIEIHIERQDAYGPLTPRSELRFYVITRYHAGAEVTSVVTRARVSTLARSLLRRVREDTGEYLQTREQLRDHDIKGFTNTM